METWRGCPEAQERRKSSSRASRPEEASGDMRQDRIHLLRSRWTVTVTSVLPPTQLSKLTPGSLVRSGGRPAVPGGFKGWPHVLSPFLVLSGEWLRGPESRPEVLTNEVEPDSAGDCFCLASR